MDSKGVNDKPLNNTEENDAGDDDDEVCDLSPTVARTYQIHNSRRSSFLYNDDVPYATLPSLTGVSKAPSVSRYEIIFVFVLSCQINLPNIHSLHYAYRMSCCSITLPPRYICNCFIVVIS